MEKFSYINATSLEQVTSLLSESGWGEVMLIAGGTDLLAEIKEYVESPKTLINLKTLPGMDSIEADASGLKIGALATVDDIARHPTIQHHYTVLAQAGSLCRYTTDTECRHARWKPLPETPMLVLPRLKPLTV